MINETDMATIHSHNRLINHIYVTCWPKKTLRLMDNHNGIVALCIPMGGNDSSSN
jgi:hypothetical protein